MSIQEFFKRFNCSKQEINDLLNYLQSIRINKVINEIQNIRQSWN